MLEKKLLSLVSASFKKMCVDFMELVKYQNDYGGEIDG